MAAVRVDRDLDFSREPGEFSRRNVEWEKSPKVDVSDVDFDRQFFTMDPTQVGENGCVGHTDVRAQLLQYAS